MEHLSLQDKRTRLRIISGVSILLLVFYLAAQFGNIRNTTIVYEGLKIRLPFSAEMKTEKPDRTVYYDRMEDEATIDRARNVSFEKCAWTAEEYEAKKEELIADAYRKQFGEKDTPEYRWVYVLTDTGPEIYRAYVLDPQSGKAWTVQSYRITEIQFKESLDRVSFVPAE